MKNYIFVLFLAVGVIAQAQTKLGTIDADYILGQLPESSTVEENMKNYNTELQGELQKTVGKYEELVSNYQATSGTATEEERTALEEEIINLENDIKNFRQKATVLLQMRRNELTQPLYNKIQEAMQEVIQEQNYTQIINASANALAFADPAYDITDLVMEKLGITTN